MKGATSRGGWLLSGLFLVLFLAGQSAAEEQTQALRLRWLGTRSSAEVLTTSPYSTVSVRAVPFSDLRKDPFTLGMTNQRTYAYTAKRLVVSGSPTVAEWMAEGVNRVLTQFGIKTDSAASFILSGKIVRLEMDEVKFYSTLMTSSVSLSDASGNVLWEKTFSSRSENWGAQGSELNYIECLNDAARAIIYAALNDASLHQAVERATN